MATKKETNNNVNETVTNFNNHEKWLIARMTRILDNKNMTEQAADTMMEMISDWKDGINARRIQAIEAQIAELTAMKEALL